VGRGPFAALLAYAGVLFPAMGFVNVYPMRFSWVADHFAYQAVAVLAAATVCGAAAWGAAWPPAGRRGAAFFAAAVLVALGARTSTHTGTFRDEDTLWTATLQQNPACFMCETNYGISLLERGRTDEAAAHLEASRRLKPDEVSTLLNLARVDELRGRLGEAAATLREARRVAPSNAAVLVNLANAEARAGRVEEAIAAYREALAAGSSVDYLAHNGLGAALVRKGALADGIAHFREAVRLRPDYAAAGTNLERALKTASEKEAVMQTKP
jgi:tetratricopeptide (TPR) repeat protein